MLQGADRAKKQREGITVPSVDTGPLVEMVDSLRCLSA